MQSRMKNIVTLVPEAMQALHRLKASAEKCRRERLTSSNCERARSMAAVYVWTCMRAT